MDLNAVHEGHHLKEYYCILAARKFTIVIFFLLVVALVVCGSMMMDPVYSATVTILVDAESPDVLTATGMVSLENQNYFSYKEYYQSQKEMLLSRSIAKKVFEDFDLAQYKEYNRAKDPIKSFLKDIKAESVRDTRLIKLEVESKYPEMAARIANRIAELHVMRNLFYISRGELMNLLKNEYLKLTAKLSEYNKVYLDKHPKMIRLKKEINEIVEKIDNVKGDAFDFDMTDDDKITDSLYSLEGLKANNISIQDPAEVPVDPIRPKMVLNVILGIVAGLLGGIAIAFYQDYMDETIKSQKDVKKLTDWQFLGNIPLIKHRGLRREITKDLWVHLRPDDPASEAFRTIRTSISFDIANKNMKKSTIVTSPGPQEGKTTTLCNLGICFAKWNKKVLIVDADMRKPRLHLPFKKKNDKGLSDLLNGALTMDEVVQSTDVEGLFIVTSGPHPSNPSELISNDHMKAFIELAQKEYDLVLFDTPPIAIVTDAILLSSLVGGTVIVIESAKTSVKVLPVISNTLNECGSEIKGFVVNKLTSTSDSTYYAYSRYYSDARPSKRKS